MANRNGNRNQNNKDCYVVNCQCQCRPCALYRAWMKYRGIDMSRAICWAECTEYRGDE